ncbi:DUF4168 domain-containing protein [Leptolyngbya sp. FACHB-541]|uniref:DUF4168 domain-containing protein n=1 Tax=Leptolyngbya sp. FACHB-541 TaxID=2692810 RepID=UPI001683CBA8|nr:DUF4168 domain-containing protein [Leptolyngbya sp. FACHB-541]MBD1999682.1 DUF4168 domain-containing protein [Leptolyngbya sp. FACHB-541]
MLKQILAGSTFLLLVAFGSLPARSQTSAPPTAEPTEPSAQQLDPAAQPAPPTEAQSTPPTQAQPQSAAEVSSEDIEKFARAIAQLQTIQQETQTELLQIVEGQGLTPDRFNEIAEAQQNPQAGADVEISDEELQSFEQAANEITTVRQQTQARFQEAVQAEGLEVEQFNQILAAVQQDPALQQEVEQILRAEPASGQELPQ